MLPCSRLMSRPDGAKEKTVFAPMRVMVWSGAVNSARESAPVRIRSGDWKSSFTLAGAAALVGSATTFTSRMTAVKVLWVGGAAESRAAEAPAKPSTRILVFIMASGYTIKAFKESTGNCQYSCLIFDEKKRATILDGDRDLRRNGPAVSGAVLERLRTVAEAGVLHSGPKDTAGRENAG